MADTQMLPCAHCGCEPMMEEHPAHSHSVELQALVPGLPDHPGSWTIECPTSGCVALISATCADVIAAWNRRAPLASRPAEVGGSPVDQACARVRRAEAELKAARKALVSAMSTVASSNV